MRPGLATMLLAALLSACGGGVRTTAEPVRYDYGSLSREAAPWQLPVATLEVLAAPWLVGTEMHYRLAYAEPLRRRSYAESRWAAPPAALLESALKRHLASAPAAAGGCRLRLVLDEFEQRFDAARQSQLVVAVSAQLLPLRGADVLWRRNFQVSTPAATPNAHGAAAAARDAVQALGDNLGDWLTEQARQKPASIERCHT